jgi:hypothetical protein
MRATQIYTVYAVGRTDMKIICNIKMNVCLFVCMYVCMYETYTHSHF